MVNERKTRFLAPTFFPKLSQHPNRLKKENELTTQKQKLAEEKKKNLITDLAKNAIKGGANHGQNVKKPVWLSLQKREAMCARRSCRSVWRNTLISNKINDCNLETTIPSTPNKFIDNKKKSQQKPQV